MSKILVTGGAGFMGSWLVDELLERGHEVINVDNLSGGYLRNVNKDCRFVKGDLRNYGLVKRLTKGVDTIFHLAAYAAEGQSIFSPIAINDINVTSMNNLMVASVNNNVDKVVFTSSTGVYGDQKAPFSESMPRRPEDPYGAGKAYCEEMLEMFQKAYGLRYSIIRPHNVYGPRQNIADSYRNVLGIWMNRIMRGKRPIIYGDGEQTRAFSYIDETTRAIANAGLSRRADSHVINVGSPEAVSINEACSMVLETMESKLRPVHANPRLGEVKHSHCTTEKSQRLLGYRNDHDLRTGLELMAEWARDLGPQKPTYVLPLEITRSAPQVWIRRFM
jgi:UDP-glucose 4-epimerase